MLSSIQLFFAHVTPRDLLDVLLVAIVIYNILLLIRGTRAVQILLGILFLVGIYYLSIYTGLHTLQTTLETFFKVLPVAVLILFQDELRRALARFGRRPVWGFGASSGIDEVFNEVVLAAATLSSRRVGALIVLERTEGLKNYVENGITLDATVSYDLLLNIFNTHTPLHDGAVIIQGERIAGAACFLPLTQNPELSKEYGTRHRAALGISEETDAAVVVVSEETGAISVAYQGQLITDLDSNTLRTTLYQYLVTDLHSPSPPEVGAGERRHLWGLRFTALALAGVLWASFTLGRAGEQPAEKVVEVAVTYNSPPGLIILNPVERVRVRLRGPEQEIQRINPYQIDVVVSIEAVTRGGVDIPLSPENVRGPTGIAVVSIEPNYLHLELDQEIRRFLSVQVQLTGEPAAGAVAQTPQPRPQTVLISGPASLVSNLDHLQTSPISLNGHALDFEESAMVISPDPLIKILQSPVVTVRVPMQEPLPQPESAGAGNRW